MADDLSGIDTSHLDGLAKIEADQRALVALSEKAAWHRDKIVEVYSRVVRDYEARIKGLDEQANALRQRAREDLLKLDVIYTRSREAVDHVRAELQESEFRHDIGEFTREQFQEQQQAAERTLAERQQEFERIGKLRARYLELLRIEGPPAAAPPPPAAPPPAAEAIAAVPAPPSPPPPVTAPAPKAPAPAAPKAAGGASDGATSFMPPPSTADFKVPSPAAAVPVSASTQIVGVAPPADAAPGGNEPFGTVAISSAMLIEDRSGLPGAHHRLGMVTTIGRTPDNQIVVPVREVSRKHAEVALTEGGYVLKDLGSPNGTFVNGLRVSEHRLADGDRIGMGGQVFVFKAR